MDYEKRNHAEHLEAMKELDATAKAASTPVYYSWINVTCHPEVLQFFKIDQFQIPTLVFYYPEKELQANLIGKFQIDTISDHEDRFIRGRLGT